MKPAINLIYSTDGSRMKGSVGLVVFPKNVKEVQNAVTTHNDLVPRGAGSNIVGACIPNNSVVIDMKKMNKIIFDPESKTVNVGAGVTIKELNEKLKAVKYEFPIIAEGTIGGMVAMNSIGHMGAYGNIKEWVDEIEFVNGRGELVKIGKADLSDVCGMEGITGIITNTKLKLLPLSKNTASIFQTNELEEIFTLIKRLKLEKEIIMMRLYSPYVSKLLGFPEKYNMIIGFSSERGKIKGEEYKKLLNKIRKDYYYLYAEKYYDASDPQFFFDKVKEFILFLDRLKVPYFVDLNMGIVYPFFKDDIKKKEVTKMIRRMNGKPGKYGIGLKRKDLLDPLQKKIIQRVKLRHDPFGKMNKGKVIDIIVDETNTKEREIKLEKKENIIINNPEKNYELKEKLIDYENIFKSELADEKKDKIANFAKNVSREIVKKTDEDLINKIMLNKIEEEEKEDESRRT